MKSFKDYLIEARSYKYIVGFTFGQNLQVSDRVFSFVRTKRSLKWAIQRAIELTVKQAPGLNDGQIETKVFKDEDEMADFWYDLKNPRSVIYDGLKSSDLL